MLTVTDIVLQSIILSIHMIKIFAKAIKVGAAINYFSDNNNLLIRRVLNEWKDEYAATGKIKLKLRYETPLTWARWLRLINLMKIEELTLEIESDGYSLTPIIAELLNLHPKKSIILNLSEQLKGNITLREDLNLIAISRPLHEIFLLQHMGLFGKAKHYMLIKNPVVQRSHLKN